MSEYKIVRGRRQSIDDFVKDVNAAIELEFSPVGPMVVYDNELFQTMVKPDDWRVAFGFDQSTDNNDEAAANPEPEVQGIDNNVAPKKASKYVPAAVRRERAAARAAAAAAQNG